VRPIALRGRPDSWATQTGAGKRCASQRSWEASLTPPHNLRDLVASRIRDGAIGARQGFVRFVRFGESAVAIRRRRAPKPGGEGLKVRSDLVFVCDLSP
jgi:hypothetical protein